jgi:AcrR family transcriptional regulator
MTSEKAVTGVRRQQYVRRREELLQAALRVFAKRGVEAASMREIASEAGVVPGLLHHYFGKKELLILEVIERYGFLAGLDDILRNTDSQSARQVLTKIATRFRDLLTEDADLMTLFFTGLANKQIRAGLDKHVAIGQQHLADFLADRVLSGELRPHDTTAAASMLFSAMSIGQLTSTVTNPKVLVDLLLNGLVVDGEDLSSDGEAVSE